jgi:hypothetical protein
VSGKLIDTIAQPIAGHVMQRRLKATLGHAAWRNRRGDRAIFSPMETVSGQCTVNIGPGGIISNLRWNAKRSTARAVHGRRAKRPSQTLLLNLGAARSSQLPPWYTGFREQAGHQILDPFRYLDNSSKVLETPRPARVSGGSQATEPPENARPAKQETRAGTVSRASYLC